MTSARSPEKLQRLLSGEAVFGIMQTMPSPTVTELAVWSGFDFVVLDCEHGIVDESAHLASLQAVAGTDAFAMVRVRPGDLGAVGRYLDFGADGVLMSDVGTAQDAMNFVAAATHGPVGTRSSTGRSSRAERYGLNPSSEMPRYILMGLIESRESVSNISAIAQTPGLDGLVIGHQDLSGSLGCSGDYSESVYSAALREVEQAAVGANRMLGGAPYPGSPVERLLSAGYQLIVAGVDTIALRDGFEAQLAAAKRIRD